MLQTWPLCHIIIENAAEAVHAVCILHEKKEYKEVVLADGR